MNSDVTLEDVTFVGQLGDTWSGPFTSSYSPVFPDTLVSIPNSTVTEPITNATYAFAIPRKNVHIRGCKFYGGSIGIGATYLSDSTITDCVAEYQYYQAYGLGNQYDGLAIIGCVARWSGNEGFKIGSAAGSPFIGRGLKVIGNYAEGCGWLGLSDSNTTEGYDCYWTATGDFTIADNTANRCYDGGWEMKTAHGDPFPDPINETYSRGIVSNNKVILITDEPGFQLKIEGDAPFQQDYVRDITFSGNQVKYDYPTIYVDQTVLGSNPISTTSGSLTVTVNWPNNRAVVGDIVMVRG